MRTAVSFILLSLTCILSAQDKPDSTQFRFYGAGFESCGDWSAHSKLDRSTSRISDQSWVLGFVSGAAFGGFKIAPTDLNAMTSWMDNYCNANPLENVNKAASMLSLELHRKAERPISN